MPDPEEIGAKILGDKMRECREHHFNSSGRCSYCSMQSRYYYEALSALNSWSKKEKEDPAEHWHEKMDSYKCEPHTHKEGEK